MWRDRIQKNGEYLHQHIPDNVVENLNLLKTITMYVVTKNISSRFCSNTEENREELRSK